MADLQCPLAPHVIDMLPLQNRMNLAHVKEIEQHVLSAGPCLHPPLKQLVLHGSLDGSTPLMLACEEGHLDAVKHIVEWGTDVNAAAKFYHSTFWEKIEGATPIFVAAHEGHSDIVEYLISEGADVSSCTSKDGHPSYAGLTPLHAALMPCHYVDDQSYPERCLTSNIIVRKLLKAGANPSTLASDGTPVWMMGNSSDDTTIALVNYGLDLNLLNKKGETILHCWSRGDGAFTEIMKLVADRDPNLMMVRDNEGFTPILRAAQMCEWKLFNWMLERNDIDRSEKIDALELANSYLLLKSDEGEECFEYWRRAQQLREATEERVTIKKNRLPCGMTEWITLTELENVINDRQTYWIQSNLTRLRIYSTRSLQAVEEQLEEYFNYLDIEPDEYELDYLGLIDPVKPRPVEPSFEDGVTHLKAYLEVILKFHPEKRNLWKQNTNRAVQEIMYMLPRIRRDDALRNVESIQTILELILVVDPDRSELSYEFFASVTAFPEILLNQNIRKYLLRSACKNDEYTSGWLAWACHCEDWKTVRLLLHLGVDPNKSTLHDGNGPLHIVTNRGKEHPRVLQGKLEREQVSMETEYTAAHLLFDFGANPYAINKEGKTAVDLWMEKNCGGEGMESIAWKNRPSWCRETVPMLACLAAKTIHAHGICFSRDPKDLSVKLQTFLENH